MNEKGFTLSIRNAIAKKGHWTRVENCAGIGMPDINFFYNKRDIWIEVKVAKGQRVIFEASQITWFTRRQIFKGDYLVFVRKNNTMWIARASSILDKVMWPNAGGKPWVELNVLQSNASVIQHKPIDWDIVMDFLKSF
ncbi:MAG TPA: hypothetical protein EYQ21_05035 [Flavobacteriales bacterium]|nr:hypothetical protein [Flavobacteriales bacterium]